MNSWGIKKENLFYSVIGKLQSSHTHFQYYKRKGTIHENYLRVHPLSVFTVISEGPQSDTQTSGVKHLQWLLITQQTSPYSAYVLLLL